MRGARSSPTTGEAGPTTPRSRIPGSATPIGRGSAGRRHITCSFLDPSRTPRRSRGWADAGPSSCRFLTTPVSTPSADAGALAALDRHLSSYLTPDPTVGPVKEAKGDVVDKCA